MKGKSPQTINRPNPININPKMNRSYNTITLMIPKEETPRPKHIRYQLIKGNPQTPNKIQLPINSIIRPLSPIYKYTAKSNRSFNLSQEKRNFSGNKVSTETNTNSQLLKPSRIAVAKTPTVKSRRYLRFFKSQGGSVKGGTITLESDYFKKHIKEIVIIQKWWKTIQMKGGLLRKTKYENSNTTGKKSKENQVKTIVIKKVEHKVISPERFLTKSINKLSKYKTKDDIKINLNEVFPEHANKNNNLSIVNTKTISNKQNIINNSTLLEVKPSFRQSFVFKNKAFTKELIQPVKQFEETICFNQIKNELNYNNILKYQKESELFFEGIINNHKSQLFSIEQKIHKEEYDKFIKSLNFNGDYNLISSINDFNFQSKMKYSWNNNKEITEQTIFSLNIISKEKRQQANLIIKYNECSIMYSPNKDKLTINKFTQLQFINDLRLNIIPSSSKLISNNK